jgi:hypothetical protein
MYTPPQYKMSYIYAVSATFSFGKTVLTKENIALWLPRSSTFYTGGSVLNSLRGNAVLLHFNANSPTPFFLSLSLSCSSIYFAFIYMFAPTTKQTVCEVA